MTPTTSSRPLQPLQWSTTYLTPLKCRKASYNILKNSYNLIKESLNIFKVPCTTSQEPPQKTPQYIAVKLDHASGLQAYMLTVLLLIGNAGVSYCFVTGYSLFCVQLCVGSLH